MSLSIPLWFPQPTFAVTSHIAFKEEELAGNGLKWHSECLSPCRSLRLWEENLVMLLPGVKHPDDFLFLLECDSLPHSVQGLSVINLISLPLPKHLSGPALSHSQINFSSADVRSKVSYRLKSS